MRPGLLWDDARSGTGPAVEAWAAARTDLGLDAVVAAMAGGDPTIEEAVRAALAVPLRTRAAVLHRQGVVADALRDPALPRELYALADAAVQGERTVWGGALRSPELVLDRAAQVIELFVARFRELRELTGAHAGRARSDGLIGFLRLVEERLDEGFLADAAGHARRLRERTLVVEARLGPGNRGAGYRLLRAAPGPAGLRGRVRLDEGRGMRVEVSLRDTNGLAMVADLRAAALAPTAAAAREAADRMLAFWQALRAEAAFLVGAVRLRDAFERVGAPWCVASVLGDGEGLEARGLYDPALALALGRPVTGNDVRARGRRLVVLTGANGGGKSTLLRAIGLAQLLLQAGLPVAAEAFAADLRSGVLTHFVTDEAAPGAEGRLDEELRRLSALVDAADASSLVLLNETFATANEQEGSELATGVLTALADAGVRAWYVTHHHGLAQRLAAERPGGPLFLRAERGEDGQRPYRVVEAPPLVTAFGLDVYRRVMGEGAGTAPGDKPVADARDDARGPAQDG